MTLFTRGAGADRRSPVATVAAHRITPSTASTWDATLPRTARVLVPVQLDVLLVRSDGGTWADCRMREPSGTGGVQRLLPDPFTDLAGGRKRGAYLHWALPDALTVGDHASAGELRYPPIPDRWLVLRISPAPSDETRRAVRGWILEVTAPPTPHKDLKGWTESHPATTALTALGLGDPAWAAYYDNVADQLAFYDDLVGVPAGAIAYVVAGWYADPSADPLGDPNIRSLTDFYGRMAELRWEIPGQRLATAAGHAAAFVRAANSLSLRTRERPDGGPADGGGPVAPDVGDADVGHAHDTGGSASGTIPTDGSWWPRLTLYHGAAVGFGWPTADIPGHPGGLLGGAAGGRPAADTTQVAFGNTLAEALGALVARANGSPDEARTLEAFQLGALADLDHPDGRARVDALLHASAFSARPGGEDTDSVRQPARAAEPAPPSSEATSGTKAVPSTGTSPIAAATAAPPAGGIAEAMAALDQPATATSAPSPGEEIDVQRSRPRFFEPMDPVVLVQGGGRSYKHGGDGRFTQDGTLSCRLTGSTVTEISALGAPALEGRIAARAEDVLANGVENGSVPPECESILEEAVLLDPGSARAIAGAALRTEGPGAMADLVNLLAVRLRAEQTAWWATRDIRVDHGPLLAMSGISGTLPSPVAITMPADPWHPRHIDWTVDYHKTAGGMRDWSLGEVDMAPNAPPNDTTGLLKPTPLSGRALVTGGAAAALAGALRKALDTAASTPGSVKGVAWSSELIGRVIATTTMMRRAGDTPGDSTLAGDGPGEGPGGASPVAGSEDTGPAASSAGDDADRTALEDIVGALMRMDVVGGTLDGLHAQLRTERAQTHLVTKKDEATAAADDPQDPKNAVPIRSGFLRVRRLRLVDGFGQVVDLAGSSATTLADPARVVRGEAIAVETAPSLLALPPRFTAPARLLLRFTDAGGGEQEAGSTTSPVCGYLQPNHLEGSLELFDASGAELGKLVRDEASGVAWRDVPGRPSLVGGLPSTAIPNRFLGAIADEILRWGAADAAADQQVEGALGALLRVIDSTRWTVDPFGHAGDEHLALLLGHPIVVMRARLRLDVDDPVLLKEQPENLALPVAVRLGSLTQWEDGLLGYFVDDDHSLFHCVAAAAAELAREIGPGRGFLSGAAETQAYYETFADDVPPDRSKTGAVTHRYVRGDTAILVHAGREVTLTLLVEPLTAVNATSGIVPRKAIGMRRGWLAGLAKLAPTFRVGPVLVEPDQVRMPVATEFRGTWSWSHRKDVTEWANDPVVNATTDALLPTGPAAANEGWLRYEPEPGGET